MFVENELADDLSPKQESRPEVRLVGRDGKAKDTRFEFVREGRRVVVYGRDTSQEGIPSKNFRKRA
ncbi:MAG TPA: hypothetical protein VF189_05075 [Patescibacteria group bacterium]